MVGGHTVCACSFWSIVFPLLVTLGSLVFEVLSLCRLFYFVFLYSHGTAVIFWFVFPLLFWTKNIKCTFQSKIGLAQRCCTGEPLTTLSPFLSNMLIFWHSQVTSQCTATVLRLISALLLYCRQKPQRCISFPRSFYFSCSFHTKQKRKNMSP